jgi:predicted MPP superfamily phosphohydrolase
MNPFILLLLSFFLVDLLWWTLAHRRLRARAARVTVAAWALLMLGGLALLLGSRWLGNRGDELMPRPVISALFLWHLLILPLWLLWSLGRGLMTGTKRLVRGKPIAESGMSRREFLGAAATFAPAVLTAGAALGSEGQLEEFRIRRIELPLPTLPPGLDGLTIAHVSDVHVGRFTRGAVLERIVRATNDLDADLAVFTGDLINFALRELPAGIDLIRGLRARHGVFLCEGNHDLFEDATAFRRAVLRAGLPFLRGEGATLDVRGEKLQVLGLPWTHGEAGHARAIAELERLRQEAAFPLLLAHHPHAFDFATHFPLMLAGHTHGGQIMANDQVGFGPLFFRYWSGLYRREGRTLVVSNGVGNWFPLRIAAPAEIVHLTLRRA